MAVNNLTVNSLLKNYSVFVMNAFFGSLAADLYFSLVHRLTHKYMYKGYHEIHHK